MSVSVVCINCLFDFIFYVPVNNYVVTGLPGLNQYKAGDKMSCSRTQCSASGKKVILKDCMSYLDVHTQNTNGKSDNFTIRHQAKVCAQITG